jgi:catechol 2,3-dioxygenase
MAFHGTVRPGLIQMKVLDLDKTLNFYKNILGLDEVGKTSDGRVMLKAYDEFDHHSVVLRMDKTPGLDYVGFKVLTADQLEDIKAKTEKFGYKVTEVAPNSEQPGFGKQYKF